METGQEIDVSDEVVNLLYDVHSWCILADTVYYIVWLEGSMACMH